MDAYATPQAPSGGLDPLGIVPTLLSAVCIALGVVGLLMVCMNTATTGWSYIAPSFMDPAQAAAMESVRASQGWWVLPVTLLHLLGKLLLSAGLVVGGVAVIARQSWGGLLFKVVLGFGIGFEILVAGLGAAYTGMNSSQMGQDFGDIMASDPNMDPAIGQAVGDMFGWMMLGGMVFLLLWAIAKSALYSATLFSIRGR